MHFYAAVEMITLKSSWLVSVGCLEQSLVSLKVMEADAQLSYRNLGGDVT